MSGMTAYLASFETACNTTSITLFLSLKCKQKVSLPVEYKIGDGGAKGIYIIAEVHIIICMSHCGTASHVIIDTLITSIHAYVLHKTCLMGMRAVLTNHLLNYYRHFQTYTDY